MSTVLSVRVRRELKMEAERLGLNVREIVEEALEAAVRRARRERMIMALRGMSEQFRGLSGEQWVSLIREFRRRGGGLA